ncbi:hypothetical protein GWK47_018239 [Chionoecetes opilio]|uniref:Uncharacterized protein n=1 Tax=Chionoecetes opilio TaxID=41210 RepID=A0A8J4XQV9_CHIOP|nr:hypothetical protein GWK47_018239 [Chionoecetes opilio]
MGELRYGWRQCDFCAHAVVATRRGTSGRLVRSSPPQGALVRPPTFEPPLPPGVRWRMEMGASLPVVITVPPSRHVSLHSMAARGPKCLWRSPTFGGTWAYPTQLQATPGITLLPGAHALWEPHRRVSVGTVSPQRHLIAEAAENSPYARGRKPPSPGPSTFPAPFSPTVCCVEPSEPPKKAPVARESPTSRIVEETSIPRKGFLGTSGACFLAGTHPLPKMRVRLPTSTTARQPPHHPRPASVPPISLTRYTTRGRRCYKGIIGAVPAGAPTKWCSEGGLCQKKDGRPRRTVDFQPLNRRPQRDTPHQTPPLISSLRAKQHLRRGTHTRATPRSPSTRRAASSNFSSPGGATVPRRPPHGPLAPGRTKRFDDTITDVPGSSSA